MHLNTKYAALQASLTPRQQQAFTQSLRITFGREGMVSHGGVGVVALSLAVLFDALAREVKGVYESKQEPVPGLFLKDPRGHYAPSVHTISRFLRLVPHIANNPTRMRDETQRYLEQLIVDDQAFERSLMKAKQDDVTVLNRYIGQFLQWPLYLHLHRLANASFADAVVESAQKQLGENNKAHDSQQSAHNEFYHNVNFNLNCDPEEGSRRFLDTVERAGLSADAFRKCWRQSAKDSNTWLHHISREVWLDVVTAPVYLTGNKRHLIAQKDDFDLRAGALGNWTAK